MSSKTAAFSRDLLSWHPQVSLARSTTSRMWMVSACAFLAVLQSSLADSFSSFSVALAATAGAVLVELAVNFKLKIRTLRDGSAVASALIFTLLLPNTFSPPLAFIGAAFAMIVVKHSFGGLGANWVNPALGAWLFVRLSWPGAFNQALENSPPVVLSELLSQGERDLQGSPLGLLAIRGMEFGGDFSLIPRGWLQGILGSWGTALGSFFNRTIFAFLGVEVPASYWNLLSSPGPGIIGDRGLLLFLLGTIVITAFQVSRSWIPALFLGVYALLVRLFGAVFWGGSFFAGDLLFGLCYGGVMVSAFLLAADPATGPKSVPGMAAVTVLAASLAFIFRYLAFEPYGAFYVIALLNILVPLIREAEGRLFYYKGEYK
ncbi:MAG: RnfABCDGE type electron transport complex subunit D [Treponema sp.]|nr:RnfABCDGE type electron transport complex subunit D [Treponema sp.]